MVAVNLSLPDGKGFRPRWAFFGVRVENGMMILRFLKSREEDSRILDVGATEQHSEMRRAWNSKIPLYFFYEEAMSSLHRYDVMTISWSLINVVPHDEKI